MNVMSNTAADDESVPESTTAFPGADRNSEPEQRQELELKKLRAEIQKLEQETTNLKNANNWWYTSFRNVPFPSWLNVAIAIGLGIAGFYTGIFNTLRDRNEAQGERLKAERFDLEHRKDALSAEIASKEKELEAVAKRVQPLEQEANAIEELRELASKGLFAHFAVGEDFDGVDVSLIRGGWTTVSQDGELLKAPPAAHPNLPQALAALHRIRVLKGVGLYGFSLENPQIFDILSRSELEIARFRSGGLTSNVLDLMRLPMNLRKLSLQDNRIETIAGLNFTESVTHLTLQGNPIGDDGLSPIASIFPNIESLNLSNTRISDEGLFHITKLQGLFQIDIRETNVTERGIPELLKCPRLHVLVANSEVLTDDLRSSLRKASPYMHIESKMRTDDDAGW